MYVCMYRFGGTSTRAYTRTQARGATPELRRVADTTSHGLSAGRHSTQTTIGRVNPSHWLREAGQGPLHSLRVSLYKPFVYIEAFVHEAILFFASTPLFRHPTPRMHHPHYAQYVAPPPSSLYCNMYHTILAMAISCKGQALRERAVRVLCVATEWVDGSRGSVLCLVSGGGGRRIAVVGMWGCVGDGAQYGTPAGSRLCWLVLTSESESVTCESFVVRRKI